jgi:hypothetical protein
MDKLGVGVADEDEVKAMWALVDGEKRLHCMGAVDEEIINSNRDAYACMKNANKLSCT